MGAVTITTQLANEFNTSSRRATLLLTLPASYDAGGSVLDLSALTGGGFTKVYGVDLIGQPTAASDRYHPTYIPAALYAPATGLLKVRDLQAAADAEASGDLSAVTMLVEVIGI